MAEMGNRVIFRQSCFPVRAYTGSTPARVNTMYCRWHLEDVWTSQRRRVTETAWLLQSVATNYRTNPTVRLREMTTESGQNRPRAVSHCNQLLQVARAAVPSVRGISTPSPSRMDCCHCRRSPPRRTSADRWIHRDSFFSFRFCCFRAIGDDRRLSVCLW